MTSEFYTNYDPLVANGILYAPVKTLVCTDAPIPQNVQCNPVPSKDVYTPSKSTSDWKKTAFLALCGVLAFLGAKKLGFNPLKKITNKVNFPAVKNYCTAKVGTCVNFIKGLLTKKP